MDVHQFFNFFRKFEIFPIKCWGKINLSGIYGDYSYTNIPIILVYEAAIYVN